MREIKFRAKRKDNNEWIEGYYAYKYIEDKHYILRENIGLYGSYFIETEVDKNTVRQYTGLKDKNGNEIYEGDILLHSGGGDYKFVVEFLKGYFYLKGGFKEGFIEKIYFHQTHSHNFEVIGNIYENPELLKQD